MTATPTPYDAICAAAMAHHGERADGALRAVFLDRRRTVLWAIGFDEGTRHVDELFLKHLVAIVTDLRLAVVVFAVLRATGRPTRIDRLLWRELSLRLADTTTHLLDVVVVGEGRRWSAAHSLAFTSAAARCPERTAPSM